MAEMGFSNREALERVLSGKQWEATLLWTEEKVRTRKERQQVHVLPRGWP